jgi:hypothetical protein
MYTCKRYFLDGLIERNIMLNLDETTPLREALGQFRKDGETTGLEFEEYGVTIFERMEGLMIILR